MNFNFLILLDLPRFKDKKMKNKNYFTNLLMAKNHFIIGIGSIFNISGSYFEYNYLNVDKDADYKALVSDWKTVFEDIKKSKEKFEIENKDLIRQ